MFRITYSEAVSQEWRSRQSQFPTDPPAIRRVYRWGTLWGLLESHWSCDRGRRISPTSITPSRDREIVSKDTTSPSLTCETRSVLVESAPETPYLVEWCEPQVADLLPAEVDDLWEEEYYSLSKGLEYNGLVMLRGTDKTVLEIAAAQGLPTPVLPPPPATAATPATIFSNPEFPTPPPRSPSRPQRSDSRPSYPQRSDSRPSYPQRSDSRPSYPQRSDSRPSYPQRSDSRPSHPQRSDSRPSHPQRSGSRPQSSYPSRGQPLSESRR